MVLHALLRKLESALKSGQDYIIDSTMSGNYFMHKRFIPILNQNPNLLLAVESLNERALLPEGLAAAEDFAGIGADGVGHSLNVRGNPSRIWVKHYHEGNQDTTGVMQAYASMQIQGLGVPTPDVYFATDHFKLRQYLRDFQPLDQYKKALKKSRLVGLSQMRKLEKAKVSIENRLLQDESLNDIVFDFDDTNFYVIEGGEDPKLGLIDQG